MNDKITFQGITYARSTLSEEDIKTMEHYNSEISNVSSKSGSDGDFEFRLNQARQMFGDAQTVDVRGTRRMRPDKKPVKATWY